MGVEHVGLGSDFDGIQRTPRGLEHAGCFAALVECMFARGFDVATVRAVLGDNMRRVFAATLPKAAAVH
jgi:membrane dipeptidase